MMSKVGGGGSVCGFYGRVNREALRTMASTGNVLLKGIKNM